MNYFDTEVRQRLLNFIDAREQMRIHKEKHGGEGPHSSDPILAGHRFCNINREHDTVTKFIHAKFRVPFKDYGKNFMVRQMLYCRIFNEPKTLAVVCPYMDNETAVKKLKDYRKNTSQKVMRGAYLMPPHGKNIGGVDIIDHWCHVVEEATGVCMVDWPAIIRNTDYEPMTKLSEVAEGLLRVCGIGPFIANQVVTDLRYVPVWGRSWRDWESFILCGPGTRRGINRFFERELDTGGNDAKFTQELLTIRANLHSDLSSFVKDYYFDPNNLSNTFCEFDKYERAQTALRDKTEVHLRHWSPSDLLPGFTS